MRATLFISTCLAALVAAGGSAPAQPVEPVPDAPDRQPDAAPDRQPDRDAAPDRAPAAEAAPRGGSRDGPAWALYHRAYAAAALGRDDDARALLLALSREHAEHPAAAVGTRMLRAFNSRGVAPAAPVTRDRDPVAGEERPTRGARAELALYQSLHGIAIGIELCVLMSCNDGAALLSLPLIAGSLALGGALITTQDGIAAGHRAAINSGTSWGAYNAGMILAMTTPEAHQTYGAALIGSQLGGLALGSALWMRDRPTEGQVALVNTFGLWSNALALLGMAALDQSFDTDDYLMAMLVVGDIGLVAGGLVASRLPDISRGRTLLLDAGGIVGAVGGMGTAVLIAGDDLGEKTAAGAALLGTVAGLAGAAYLSRDWDLPEAPPARLTLLPSAGGGLSAGVMFELD